MIGKKIKKLRQYKGMTMDALAKEVHTSRQAIYKYENGIVTNIPALRLAAIAKALDTTPAWLMGWDTRPSLRKAPKLFRPQYEIENAYAEGSFEMPDGYSQAELDHIKKYRDLDEHGKEVIDKLLDVESSRSAKEAKGKRAYSFLRDESGFVAEEEMGGATRPIPYYDLPVSAGSGALLQSDAFEYIDIPITPESVKASYAVRVSGDSMEPAYRDGDRLLIQATDALDPGEIGIFVINGEGFVKKQGVGRFASLNPAYPDIILTGSDVLKTCGRVIGKA